MCASDVANVSFDDHWYKHLLVWLYGRLLRRLQFQQLVFNFFIHGADLQCYICMSGKVTTLMARK